MTERYDFAVIGAGAAGLAAAMGLAREGARVALIGPQGTRRDGRTVALLEGSIRFLDALGAWDAIAPDAEPLATMRIVDDTGSLFRAPPLSFEAYEIGLDAFGRNVEAAILVERLEERAAAFPELTRYDASAARIDLDQAGASIALGDGRTIEADLIVGADGRRSLVRQALGIPTRDWAYPQTAITAILAHDQPHENISTEFHTRNGPFTLVPLPGQRSSLVWVCAPEEAERLDAIDDARFAAAVERQAQFMLGRMRLDGPRGRTPMGGMSVSRFAGPRGALVGEAAHIFPPIGAQGLNLGLRDAAALRDAYSEHGLEDGGTAMLAAYTRGRAIDVPLRTAGVDMLNRSLLAGILPIDLARGIGMLALDRIKPLRQLAMRAGLAPRFGMPSLMR